jgi:hypothetical protein
MSQSDFFKGDVYKATWITDSIKANELLDKDDYYYRTFSDLESKKNKRFELNNHCSYTLTEAFKITELAHKNPQKSKSATFWKEIEMRGGIIPERTGDSMRNFLKVSLKLGLLEFYKEHVGTCKYSHAFSTILKVKPMTQPPTITTNEKNYLRTATWSEYAFENYQHNQKALAPFMQTS